MTSHIDISAGYREVLDALSLATARAVFTDPRLSVWRDLEDRDNSTLDTTLADGRAIRLHVKRDKRKRREPMSLEARGIGLLNAAGIESAPLVAHGSLGERTFVITENLDGYLSADRLMETDTARLPVLLALTSAAARLHNAGLHHRDLYANHFYLRVGAPTEAVRLIDTARVRPLPALFRERWLVKDVAQLFFSVTPYVTQTAMRDALWADYLAKTNRVKADRFIARVEAKVAWIDRHDRALRAKKPKRNLRLAGGN